MDYLVFKELYHSGIKGMKWGVRRYQDENGNLTAEGKKRYLNDLKESKQKYKNNIKIVKDSRKQYEEERSKINEAYKTSKRLDKPIGDAVGHGIKTGLKVTGIGLATYLGGVAIAKMGVDNLNAGATKAGIIIGKVGDLVIGSAAIAGIGSGIKRVDQNIKLSKNGGN